MSKELEKTEGGTPIERGEITDKKHSSTLPPLADRVSAFNEELSVILAKHSLNIASEAFIQEGKIVSRPIVVDVPPKDEEEK